jgi:uncharacterized iron-regulated membrane protein
MHRAFLLFHRWLALTVSVFVAVAAASGALLVLEGPVARMSRPHVLPAGTPLSVDELAARARAASGGGAVTTVVLGDGPELAWSFRVAPPGGRGRAVSVTINPYTGDVVADPATPGTLVPFLQTAHALHTRLLGGETGAAVVTVATAAAFLLVVSGAVIWWRDKLWRLRSRESWKRLNYDLHHSLGIFSSVVLLLITSTGVWVHVDQIDDLMRRLDRRPVPSPPAQPDGDPGAPIAPLDAIAAAARAAVPGADVMNIVIPPGSRSPVAVQLKYPEDHTPAGRSHVYVDRYRGTVLLAVSTRTAEPGQHLIDIKRALHTGDIYGLPTQILWALASLVLASQAVTGVLMWWNGRAGGGARSRKKSVYPM